MYHHNIHHHKNHSEKVTTLYYTQIITPVYEKSLLKIGNTCDILWSESQQNPKHQLIRPIALALHQANNSV